MKNIYKFSGGAGAESRPGLKFDVVKVRGREEDRENIAHTEVITITGSSTEEDVVEEIMRFGSSLLKTAFIENSKLSFQEKT